MRSSALLPPERRYSPLAIFLHWGIAALIVIGWTLPHLRGLLPQNRAPIMNLHRSVGMTVFALVLLRLVWRFFNAPPALPGGTAQILRWLSHAGHAALYLLMLGVPACGMLMTWAAGPTITVWGLFTVPAAIAPAPDLRETFEHLHGLLGNALIWLAVAHAAAALVHHYVFKDGLLDRMLPGQRRRSPSRSVV